MSSKLRGRSARSIVAASAMALSAALVLSGCAAPAEEAESAPATSEEQVLIGYIV